jgi:hypothetical protein
MQPGEEYCIARFSWDGEVAPTKVTVCVDGQYEIDHFKDAMIRKHRLDNVVRPSMIHLLKVRGSSYFTDLPSSQLTRYSQSNGQVLLVLDHSLSECIMSQANEFATQLTSMLEVFPRQPPDSYLHIFVDCPLRSNGRRDESSGRSLVAKFHLSVSTLLAFISSPPPPCCFFSFQCSRFLSYLRRRIFLMFCYHPL